MIGNKLTIGVDGTNGVNGVDEVDDDGNGADDIYNNV